MALKRKLLILMLLLSLSTLSCAPPHSTGGNASSGAYDAVYWTTNEQSAEAMLAQAARWNAIHVDRQIELEIRIFRGDEIAPKLWATLHSGVRSSRILPPDIVDIDYQDIPHYVSQSYCLLYSLDNQLDMYVPDWREQALFSPFMYRDLCFAVPFSSTEATMVYNEAALRAAGLSCAEIQTWDDFIRYAKVYYGKTGRALLAIDAEYYAAFFSIYQQIEPVYLSNREQAYLDTLAFIEQLVEMNVAQMMPGGRADSRRFSQAFASGEIAAAILPQSWRSFFDEAALQKGDYMLRALPLWGEGGAAACLPGSATAVTSQCEEFILMKEFLVFSRLDEEGASQYKHETGIPLHNVMAFSEYLNAYANDLMRTLLDAEKEIEELGVYEE